MVLGGGGPLDGGRKWFDGKPFLGGHKTIRGTFFGILVGTLFGVLQGNLVGGSLQAVGAIFGDIAISFLKRRLDILPGASFPVADQLDFIVFAVLFSYFVDNPGWGQIITIIAVTLPVHYIVNIIAWVLKLKKNPW